MSAVESLVRRWEAAEASGDDAATAELVTDDFLAVGPVGFVLDAAAWRSRHAGGLRTESLALEVGSVAGLGTTLYGQLLLVKVGLLLGMLLLAGMNEWRARSAGGAAFGQMRGLSRGIGVELTLGVVVFAVAALLSGTPPTPGS